MFHLWQEEVCLNPRHPQESSHLSLVMCVSLSETKKRRMEELSDPVSGDPVSGHPALETRLRNPSRRKALTELTRSYSSLQRLPNANRHRVRNQALSSVWCLLSFRVLFKKQHCSVFPIRQFLDVSVSFLRLGLLTVTSCYCGTLTHISLGSLAPKRASHCCMGA